MLNKLHGVKFPRSKKAYLRLAEDIATFYEALFPLRPAEPEDNPN